MSSSPDNAAAAPPKLEELLVGRRVHKYEIVKTIGRGGMGTVFEALNTTIGKRVAMKFVDAALTQNKDTVDRFQREAQAASAVESAHIVEIFDSGFTEDEIPFIVMELLRGEDLGHRIKRCGRLELGEALHVAAQILRGLHRAHEAGIVHRDLKPDNVFLVDRDDDASFVKILDFGISKMQRTGEVPVRTLTRQGTVLGTPFYMAPEQAQAMPDIDGRADLWSVGTILYECLTGHPPHTGNSYEQVIVNICTKDVPDVQTENPAVPQAIAQVIQRALAREPADRFATAREMLDALVAAAPELLPSRLRVSTGDSGERGAEAPAGSPGQTPVRITPAAVGGAAGPPGRATELAGGSRVGWSTSNRTSARAHARTPRKRTAAFVGAAALLAGALGTLLYWRTTAANAGGASAQAPVEVTLELRANVPGARFTVDGIALEDGVLRGPSGETRRVRVEADGYTPVDKELVLRAGGGPMEVRLDRLPPTVIPALPAPDTVQPAATTTPAAPTATAGAAAAPTSRPGKPAGSARPAPTGSTSPPPTPSSGPTGIGGGLKLKTD